LNIYHIKLSPNNASIIQSALEWLGKFYADIEIVWCQHHVECASAIRTHAELELIWKAALLTQINQAATAAQRRRDIEELVQ
jgi:hypothetical protein